MTALIDKFWSKVEKTDGCWLWTGGRTSAGYGLFHIGGGPVYAHRFAYELEVGPIPGDLTIDHVRARGCENVNCVNPAHLEAVTMRENILRGNGLSARRARQTHCIHGHEFTPENTYHRKDRPGSRMCRTCRKLDMRRYKAAKR